MSIDGGDGGGGGFTDILLGILIDAVNYIFSVLLFVWQWIQAAVQVIVRYVLDVARTLAAGFVKVGQFFVRLWGLLKRFWTDVLKPALRAIDDAIKAVQRFLKRLFGPLLEFLQKLRKKIQEIYDRFVRPILDVIDAMRLVLRGLAILGVDWAKELDARLAELQRLISEPLLAVIRKINEVAAIIDRIMTLDGLFQRLIWIGTLAAYRRPTINFLWNSHSTPLSGGEVTALRKKNLPRSSEELRSAISEYARFEGGPLKPRIDELRTSMRQRLRNL